MSVAGFVLAGGDSSRMGRDKALLAVDGATLIERITGCVAEAAGNVTVIGSPEKYGFLDVPVIPDAIPGLGPLGGLLTALRSTTADWNLVVACDMPRLNADFLRGLVRAGERTQKDAIVPVSPAGLEPLCAVYHRAILSRVEQAIHHKLLKMQDFVRTLDILEWPVTDLAALENVNTPEQWLEAR